MLNQQKPLIFIPSKNTFDRIILRDKNFLIYRVCIGSERMHLIYIL